MPPHECIANIIRVPEPEHICVYSICKSNTEFSRLLVFVDQYGMPEEQRDQSRGKEREKEREIEGSIVKPVDTSTRTRHLKSSISNSLCQPLPHQPRSTGKNILCFRMQRLSGCKSTV